jgi:ectoine hydroxylase-related dioxygenase (phytanoyl-CoA dioxygenase family)
MSAIASMQEVAPFIELDQPYPLRREAIQSYQENGHVMLKECLSPEVLNYYGERITEQVARLRQQKKPVAERETTYEKSFLQVMNLWRESEDIKEFVFSKRLAGIAAALMQVPRVRLYHDQALYKEVGGGITPWHVDQYYWPFSAPQTTTLWIPLLDIPVDMGPITFARKSQYSTMGRDLIISDESEKVIERMVRKLNFKVEPEPFKLGDVSFHAGWTYHRAGANSTDTERRVMTIIYIDGDIRISEPKRVEQRTDLEHWLDNRPVGSVPNGPLNPILYDANM